MLNALAFGAGKSHNFRSANKTLFKSFYTYFTQPRLRILHTDFTIIFYKS